MGFCLVLLLKVHGSIFLLMRNLCGLVSYLVRINFLGYKKNTCFKKVFLFALFGGVTVI